MEEQDREFSCCDCGEFFIFSAGEQQFFTARGFPPPVRCHNCRKLRKQERQRGEQERAMTRW
jgi:hypothetical protein